MILTSTPFRITLGGGGTDLPSYYREHGGFIFAIGIDKHMYIMLNPPTIDRKIRLHYTNSETTDHVTKLHHELAREALRLHGIEDKMEISSMADLPAGTGLGSSSSYLVGLLNALHHYRRDYVGLDKLAEEACHIELEVLRKPIGKQDQYMAAFGGMSALEIDKDGVVEVRSVELGTSSLAALIANTHVYYTGVERDALSVLGDQNSAMQSKERLDHKRIANSLHQIKEIGRRIMAAIEEEDFDAWGRLLDVHWRNKKQLSSKISFSKIDHLYDHVKAEYSVLGGKVIGAGGGGFLMLYCPKQHRRLEAFMLANGMPRLHYNVEREGSKVLANFSNGEAANFHPQVTFGLQSKPRMAAIS
jgi:D-glycero-alpha-D-manno-heptose-7-phosphate kinase